MCHQVYVNGRFAGATIDAEQRQMIVQIPTSFESAVRIEVFAVPPKELHIDLSAEIARPPAKRSGEDKFAAQSESAGRGNREHFLRRRQRRNRLRPAAQ